MIKWPKIQYYDELPQWIISSDRGAYHAASSTVHIRKGEPIIILIHELLHWFAHQFKLPFIHSLIDWEIGGNKK